MQRIDIAAVRDRLRGSGRNPRMIARLVLGVLVVANLAAALIILKPWAGSAEDSSSARPLICAIRCARKKSPSTDSVAR